MIENDNVSLCTWDRINTSTIQVDRKEVLLCQNYWDHYPYYRFFLQDYFIIYYCIHTLVYRY